MAKRDDENRSEEITIYVTPSMKEQIEKLAKDKGVTVSIVGNWALVHYVKDQRR